MRYLLGVYTAYQHLLLDLAWVKWPVSIVGGIVGFLFPTEAVQMMAVLTAGAIAIDTVTGIRASMKTGQALESKKLSRLVDKGIAYLSFLYLSASLKYFVPVLGPYEQAQVSFVLSGIFLTEGVSIFENARKMGFTLPGGLDKFFRERLLDKTDGRIVETVEGDRVVTERLTPKSTVDEVQPSQG